MKSLEKVSQTRFEDITGHVREMVGMFRRRGHKSEHAMPVVADLLGISPPRVKAVFYRDREWGMPAVEADKIERRFAEHLDREIALSIQYTEALRAKKMQLEMKLDRECENGTWLSLGSGYGSTV